MQPAELRRRLIVNADDFGRSSSINHAVIRAHREGILTTASLMVNGEAFDEAVALAREHPRLGVGLHLTLICGTSTLAPKDIPGLVDASGQFSSNPAAAGFRYFAFPGLRGQLRAEIGAQFRKFHTTGLPLDHVNGHLHLHLHPTIFPILIENAEPWHIRHMRWSYDPLGLNVRLEKGRWLYRLVHAVIFKILCGRAKPILTQKKIKHTSQVFGMLQDSHMGQGFVEKLLPELPAGDSELYSHPSLDEFKHEFDALISPDVKALVRKLNIQLIRYQDL